MELELESRSNLYIHILSPILQYDSCIYSVTYYSWMSLQCWLNISSTLLVKLNSYIAESRGARLRWQVLGLCTVRDASGCVPMGCDWLSGCLYLWWGILFHRVYGLVNKIWMTLDWMEGLSTWISENPEL